MKKINLKDDCKKCGGTDISRELLQKGELMEEGNGIDDEELAKCELIHSFCRICGYKWNNLPLKDGK